MNPFYLNMQFYKALMEQKDIKYNYLHKSFCYLIILFWFNFDITILIIMLLCYLLFVNSLAS